MTCLHCQEELPASLFDDGRIGEGLSVGRFSCPSCHAEHVRREVGRLSSGAPLYSIRLWGHLSSNRRQGARTD